MRAPALARGDRALVRRDAKFLAGSPARGVKLAMSILARAHFPRLSCVESVTHFLKTETASAVF